MDFYQKGNAFYVDEEYELAAENYTIGEQTLSSFAPLYSSRAAAYLKLKKHNQALQDCNSALRLQPGLETAHYRKGLVCFELEEFETAKKSFETSLQLLDKTKNASVLNRWIRKCDLEINELEKLNPIPSLSSPAGPATTGAVPAPSSHVEVSPRGSSSVMPVNPIKYQYYQSADCLNISILVKGISEDEAQISIESNHLRVVCKGETVIDKNLHSTLNLEKSKYEIRKTKIEIILWKEEQGIWPTIEGDGTARPKTIKSDVAPSSVPDGEVEAKRPKAYASHKDWDAVGNEISKELDAEKPEGEEALQKLFKDIYSKADSATQRAMNKVSQKNYEEERQAPKGVEWKNWEGKKLKQVEDK